jgi:hypothetical protein
MEALLHFLRKDKSDSFEPNLHLSRQRETKPDHNQLVPTRRDPRPDKSIHSSSLRGSLHSLSRADNSMAFQLTALLYQLSFILHY